MKLKLAVLALFAFATSMCFAQSVEPGVNLGSNGVFAVTLSGDSTNFKGTVIVTVVQQVPIQHSAPGALFTIAQNFIQPLSSKCTFQASNGNAIKLVGYAPLYVTSASNSISLSNLSALPAFSQGAIPSPSTWDYVCQ